MSLLQTDHLLAFYGDFQALYGITLNVEEGETVALIGANGAGKSTFLKALTGLAKHGGGAVQFGGESIGNLQAHQILARGIALVPEGRRLFPSLSVEENLVLGAKVRRPGPWTLERVYAIFPVLKERRFLRATSMSGGQQQMCAIGRALMSNPELILFDELSLGLAPFVIKDIYELLPRLVEGGVSAILVEQDVTRALASAARFLCLQEGRVSLEGEPRAHSRNEITRAYFGT